MTEHPPYEYPADDYYPEFIYSRPDAPPTSPGLRLPFSAVDNGRGSTLAPTGTSVSPGTAQRTRNVKTTPQPTTRTVPDVSTNRGLPDAGMTRADPANATDNLIRNPAEKNIPKLIVDDSVIRQTVGPGKSGAMDGNNYADQMYGYQQFDNGYGADDRAHLYGAGQQRGDYMNTDSQAVDDRWKKEVFIGEDGVVSIEPVVYEKPVYDGPFGLTRTGSYIFYIGMAVFTLLAAAFLIMCGVFYAQNYPDSSNNAAKLAGIGICAFAFYLGIQLILIGIWHQKYQKEHPKPPPKPVENNRPTARHTSNKGKSEQNADDNYPYDYSRQTQADFAPYGNQPITPYTPYGNEQILIQGNAPGTVFYPPNAWPSNGELGAQPDPKFFQPMEWAYGLPPGSGAAFAAAQTGKPSNSDTGEKKKIEKTPPRKNKVRAAASKTTSSPALPKSKVIEPPLPRLDKAPETKEIIAKTRELEKEAEQSNSPNSLSVQNVNRIRSIDDYPDMPSSTGDPFRRSDRYPHRNHHGHRHRHHHHDHHHHHSRRHRRRDSYSPCSICSPKEFHSDVGHDAHRHHHHHVTLLSTHMPPAKTFRESGVVTDEQLKGTKDTSITADLEDITSDPNNSLPQIPVVRRTVIVEPYPAEPNTQIILTPRTAAMRKVRSDDHLQVQDVDEKIVYPTVPFPSRKPKPKKTTTESQVNLVDDLNLDDVDEIEFANGLSERRRTKKVTPRKTVTNAFYDH